MNQSYRKKQLIYPVAILIVSLLSVVFLQIFKPKTYVVTDSQPFPPFNKWELSTGSSIAYWQLCQEDSLKSTPIIYLHGGPGGCVRPLSIQLWEQLTKDGFTVYLYDQAGGGKSARLKDIRQYTVQRQLDDLEEITRRIGSEKVILVGQSWGAILASLFVARYPERVDKMILTGPGPLPPVNPSLRETPAPDSLHLRHPASTNAAANQKASNKRMRTAEFLARSFGWKLVPDDEADQFQDYLRNELNKSIVCDLAHAPEAGTGGGFYSQVMTLKSYSELADPRASLRKVKCPVLVMKGQCDNQTWGYTAEYLDLFKNHQLAVISGAGHVIEIEQPYEYLKVIRKFLSEMH